MNIVINNNEKPTLKIYIIESLDRLHIDKQVLVDILSMMTPLFQDLFLLLLYFSSYISLPYA